MSKSHRIYPHLHNGKFYNYINEKRKNIILPSLYMLARSFMQRLFRKKVNLDNWFEESLIPHKSEKLSITWIGHSTFLIQIAGINILTDPVFGDLSLLFPRIISRNIEINNLPQIDFILISHNHRDHMDAVSLNKFKNSKSTSILVGKGDKAWYDSRGYKNVHEHMWWDKKTFFKGLNAEIEFTFLPSYHWSQRGLFDFNKSLWGSWMIKVQNTTIYFAGDTAYSNHFKYISKEFENIDIAIMPIGPCEPNNWMKESHVNAEEAGQGFLDLKASHFIPMHWGTFYFGTDDFLTPYNRITSWWQKQNFDSLKTFHSFKVGQRKEINLFASQMTSCQIRHLEI